MFESFVCASLILNYLKNCTFFNNLNQNLKKKEKKKETKTKELWIRDFIFQGKWQRDKWTSTDQKLFASVC